MVDKLVLIPLEDFNDWAKYYKRDTIYKSDYKWLDQDIPTYGVPTLLVVNESKLTDEERISVGKLKTAIETSYEDLKVKGHPEWKKSTLRNGVNRIGLHLSRNAFVIISVCQKLLVLD